MTCRYLIAVLNVALIFSLAGCDRGDAKPLPTNQVQVDKLEMEVAGLRSQIASQQQTIAAISATINQDSLLKAQYQSATFDPASDETYSRVDTSLGPFLMMVHEVKPNADGVKVILRIGNLAAATFDGGKLHVKWAAREPELKTENFVAAYQAWTTSIQEREIDFTNTLRPGKWNEVSVVLPGIPSNKFGYLNVSMEVSRLQLMQ